MRFLRILPEVWARTSWLLSSLTRNIAFGSSSVTVPENSMRSSFAILLLRSPAAICPENRPIHPSRAVPGQALSSRRVRRPALPVSDLACRRRRKSLADAAQQVIAHHAVGLEARLAIAFDRGRIEDRPEFDDAIHRAGQLHGAVLGFGRQRDDEVERGVLEILEGLRLVMADVDADLVHHGDGEAIDLLRAHAGAIDENATASNVAEDRRRHRRANGIPRTGEENAARCPRCLARLRHGTLATDMQHADQREQPARRVEVEPDLVGEPLAQQLRALVVETAPPHVYGFDLHRAGALDRREIALANQEVVLDDAAEWRQRQDDPLAGDVVGAADIEDQPVVLDAESEMERPIIAGDRREAVLLQQVEDGDRALVLDIGIAAHHRLLVERDLGDALLVRHRPAALAARNIETEGDGEAMRVEP